MAEPFVLQTSRLLIRPFETSDLHCYQEFLKAIAESETVASSESLFEWYRLGASLQAKLYQPPYGDRAVILRSTDQLIGSAGFVPCLDFFGKIPELTQEVSGEFRTSEVGLYYAVHPDHRRQGYAVEAASALVDFAFSSMRVKRVIATTEYNNHASQGVMRKLGMRLLRNPHPEPFWLQIVGVIHHPDS